MESWTIEQIHAENERVRAEISQLRMRSQALEAYEGHRRILEQVKAPAREPAEMPGDLSTLKVAFQKCKTCNEAHMIVSFAKTLCCPYTDKPTQLTVAEMDSILKIMDRHDRMRDN